MKKHDIPKDILNRVEQELLSGESLLWVGQPTIMRMITEPSRKTATPLAVVIMLEIIAIVLLAFTGFISVMLAMLVALGMTVIFGGLVAQYFAANSTLYAVTNSRAIVINDEGVSSYSKGALQHIKRKMHRSGRGDIIFQTKNLSSSQPSGFGLMVNRLDHIEQGFKGIENPAQVEALILETLVKDDTIVNTYRLEEQDDIVDYMTESRDVHTGNQSSR
ncbi:MAG: hypothetical protein AAF846_21110 [Chloroflexota bacterium]